MKTFNLLMAGLMLASCSKVQNFEDKTESMEKTTKSMSGTTEEMKQITTLMYKQFRSKETEETRGRKLKAIQEVEGLGEKITGAAVYFKSFEFQFWTNSPTFDNEIVRKNLLLDATGEFTRSIGDFYAKLSKKDKKKMSPTKGGKQHQDEMNFYAIAAALHLNHHYQEELSKLEGVTKISFYDMIKSALIREHNGENLEAHEEVLVNGINKEIMIELLKARVDMLSALGLRNLTDIRELGVLQKMKGGMFMITGGFLGSVDLPETYSQMNDATKKMTISFLDSAVKTRQLLQELGFPKNLEKIIKSAFENVDLKTVDRKDDTAISVNDDRREEIKTLINNLL